MKTEEITVRSYREAVQYLAKQNSDNPAWASKEFLSCSIFSEKEKNAFEDRLFRYLQTADYYEQGAFDKRTDDIGETKVFRAYLHEFIRAFQPYLLCPEKKIEVILRRDGRFRARNAETLEMLVPEGQDKIWFDLFCFKTLHDFWLNAAELRSLQKPRSVMLVERTEKTCGDHGGSDRMEFLNGLLNGEDRVIFFSCSPVDNVPNSVHNTKKPEGRNGIQKKTHLVKKPDSALHSANLEESQQRKP